MDEQSGACTVPETASAIMQENETCPPDTCPDSLGKLNEEDLQGNLYEFYLLLQQLKSGGMSFDTFLRRATAWASTRATQK